MIVLDEARRAPEPKAGRMLGLLQDVEILPFVPRVTDAARHYIRNCLVPDSPDAFHLAFAAVHEVDFLLTWNCKHLANANKTRHLAVLSRRIGLPAPVLATPYTLLSELPDEAQDPPAPA